MEPLADGYGLVEGPVWEPGHGLYFSDVLEGGVYRLGPAGGVATVIERRRGIGGMALHRERGLVVGGRAIVYWSLTSARTATLLDAAAVPGAVGFNDLTTDAAGRVYVGSLAFRVFGGDPPRPGHLHLIDLDGSTRVVADGVVLTNGLGFSPDGHRLYHSDSRSDLVRVYDVRDDGSLGPWRVLAGTGGGVPDGLAVAEDGSVWVALAQGGAVLVLAPDGSERARLPAPLPMVTSVCFGGDDLRDLYVVTGSRGGPRERCATVYRARVDVPGLPLARARVPLPPAPTTA
jgi:D-xylonolactonase